MQSVKACLEAEGVPLTITSADADWCAVNEASKRDDQSVGCRGLVNRYRIGTKCQLAGFWMATTAYSIVAVVEMVVMIDSSLATTSVSIDQNGSTPSWQYIQQALSAFRENR